MTKIYMSPVSDDDGDVANIQLYVGKFVSVLAKNPQFLDISKKGATPKIMNDIFINGLSPPMFRNKVKSLGTTDLDSTIDHLDSLYDELEILKGWSTKPKSNEKGKVEKINGNAETKESRPRRPIIPCTTQKCNSVFHTPDQCYYLHPELRPTDPKKKTGKQAFKAQVENLTSDMSMSEASIASLVDQLEQLKAEIATKADKVLQIPTTIIKI